MIPAVFTSPTVYYAGEYDNLFSTSQTSALSLNHV